MSLDANEELLDESDNKLGQIEIQEGSRKIVFRAMICDLINRGYNIALVNGLEWQDTKVRLNPPVLIPAEYLASR